MTVEQLERRARTTAAALVAMKDAKPLMAVLDPYIVVILIAQLQLALRHPSNTGRPAETSRAVIMDLIATMPEGARELLMLGFDPEYDYGHTVQ